MYKTNFPDYGSGSIIIEIRSREHFAQHFKVIAHWKKDLSDKEDVISDAKLNAVAICQFLNSGYLGQRGELAKENLELKQLADKAGRLAHHRKRIAIVYACCLVCVLIVGATILFNR